jgi:predicted NBD/HSP70 family sugar kinase
LVYITTTNALILIKTELLIMNILVIDIGGTNLKLLASGLTESIKIPSGPLMTPDEMVVKVKEATSAWQYEAISIGYPGIVKKGKIITEPHNLAPGWTSFDFEAAFKKPVRILNDAAMQALGSYEHGTLLFLGLGTGLGTAIVAKGVVIPMELAHLSYKRSTYEDYMGIRGLKRLGKKKWQNNIEDCVARFIAALQPDDVVIGGGNAKKLKRIPEGCRLGDNKNAFKGGFLMWKEQ